ncbi:MAG TPA: four helix bundle protein [Planctomycetota bacterium]|jgi:four helix bundle protein
MQINTYRDLTVWQMAMDLVEEVYVLTRLFPADERFGLTAQARRAATSIPSNIAEGYGRIHRGDYVHHLSIARGSLMELETQLLTGIRLKFVTKDQAGKAWDLSQRVGKMLTRLILSLDPQRRPGDQSPDNADIDAAQEQPSPYPIPDAPYPTAGRTEEH